METETEASGDLSLFHGRTGSIVRSVLSEEDRVNSAMKVKDNYTGEGRTLERL